MTNATKASLWLRSTFDDGLVPAQASVLVAPDRPRPAGAAAGAVVRAVPGLVRDDLAATDLRPHDRCMARIRSEGLLWRDDADRLQRASAGSEDHACEGELTRRCAACVAAVEIEDGLVAPVAVEVGRSARRRC
jgi:hypothetical protein